MFLPLSLLLLPQVSVIKEQDWRALASNHAAEMVDMLYPKSIDHDASAKQRLHLVKNHPIYNFLHTYYRYPVSKVTAYSPGIGYILEGATENDFTSSSSSGKKNKKEDRLLPSNLLSPIGAKIFHTGCVYEFDFSSEEVNRLKNALSILTSTSLRSPIFNCYGLHEWAMLYSGRRNGLSSPLEKHQNLPLRVEQKTIDDLVEGQRECSLKCTHFDAFRFFHPSAQGLNPVQSLSRAAQAQHEQPGCIHSNMDIFKYAYMIYPFIDAAILRDALRVAVAARRVDMRGSPYDITEYLEPGETALEVETSEGRKMYAIEQEKVYKQSFSVRLRLIEAYEKLLL